ncbi:hypothetical protein ES045_12100 [Polaribacter sp. IC073]|nr:hypothetical protein ES045_12100 [Polaribacter sp. IC073]
MTTYLRKVLFYFLASPYNHLALHLLPLIN